MHRTPLERAVRVRLLLFRRRYSSERPVAAQVLYVCSAAKKCRKGLNSLSQPQNRLHSVPRSTKITVGNGGRLHRDVVSPS